MRRLFALLVVSLALACNGSGKSTTVHQPGDEGFVSAAPGTRGAAGPSGPAGPAAPDSGAGNGAGDAAARALVEADLYVRRDALVYVQNTYRGLQVLDLSDPVHPRLRGALPLTGTPVGLYLVGNVALVTASDQLRWLPAEGDGPVQASYGARLWAIDVSDPDHPSLLAELPVQGAITDSRLVGDALYVVSRNLPAWYATPVGGETAGAGGAWPAPDQTTVTSFDVSTPAAPRPVDRLDFARSGWAIHVHVTGQRITVAEAGWTTSADGPVTSLTAVDISDPGGRLSPGAQITVAGAVQDRWALDLDEASGTFRAVTADGWNSGARLHVLDWKAPGAVSPRGALDLDVKERVTAARFDGSRGYVVTALAIDPLWVVDLADPSHPALAGHLEMPGQLDYLAPRGDRLLALGHGGGDPGTFQLHVSLLDVADPSHPALLARETLAPDWAFVPAATDDLHKAFQVLDAEGLILLPYQGYDRTSWSWVGGTQLLSFSRDALVREGFVPHAGDLKRAFPTASPGVLGAFSDQALQTIDANDRAHPVELGRLDLARPVWDVVVVGGKALELSGQPWWGGSAELVVTPAADPDGTATWRTPLNAWWSRLFRVGETGWSMGTTPYDASGQQEMFLQGVDLSGGEPRLGGRLAFDASSSWWWYESAVQVGSALAVTQQTWDPARNAQRAELLVADLSDVDAPRLASRRALPAADWTGVLTSVGQDVWYSQYNWVDAWSTVRYAVGRIDLSDPAHPVVEPAVNVPGWFFSASDDGRIIYTQEYGWDGAKSWNLLHALERTDHGTARLIGSVALPGGFSSAIRVGTHAYVTGWSDGHAQVAAVSLERMQVVGKLDLDAGWLWAIGAAGGKLFLAGGWPAEAVLVLGLDDPAHPTVEQTVRTSGYHYRVVVEDGAAYLPGGPYGVTRLQL